MFFVVLAWDKPGSAELRARTKPRHKEHLDAGADGLLVLQSGPLLSEHGAERGSLVVVEADQAGIVRGFVERDPYVAAGLFASVDIHPWLWRRGNPHLATTEGQAP